MACGTPVVASRISAIAEVTGEAALLFDPHDAREMAEAIEAVLGNAELQKAMRQQGLVRAAQFSWGRTAAAILGMLKEAARR
jgi:glycosyltransferase involved in cell wall biosynthesis